MVITLKLLSSVLVRMLILMSMSAVRATNSLSEEFNDQINPSWIISTYQNDSNLQPNIFISQDLLHINSVGSGDLANQIMVSIPFIPTEDSFTVISRIKINSFGGFGLYLSNSSTISIPIMDNTGQPNACLASIEALCPPPAVAFGIYKGESNQIGDVYAMSHTSSGNWLDVKVISSGLNLQTWYKFKFIITR